MNNNQPNGYYDPQTGQFVSFAPAPKKKKSLTWLYILIILAIALMITKCAADFAKENGYADEPSENETVGENPAGADSEPFGNDPAEAAEADLVEAETDLPETSVLEAEPKPETAPKSGRYTVCDVEFQYSTFVLGDKTEKWTKALCYSATPPDTIARELAETFRPETGVPLWICNLYLKTTTRILSWGNTLDVTVTEYVDGEENRADILGSGLELSQTLIDLTEEAAP